MNEVGHIPVETICDPVTLEIVRGAMRATQGEMEALIERTAMSRLHPREEGFLRRAVRRATAG